MAQNLKNDYRILFIIIWNMASTFVSPIGITMNSYFLNLVLNAVFGIDASLTYTYQYPNKRSIFDTIFMDPTKSIRSWILSRG
jgi:hypothetical protein